MEKTLSSKEMAQAFNEWMRRYTEDSKGFEHRFGTVANFLKESSDGVEPSYGQTSAAYMIQIHEEINREFA
jgi:hypothetical protein